jgi:hypothetical protein
MGGKLIVFFTVSRRQTGQRMYTNYTREVLAAVVYMVGFTLEIEIEHFLCAFFYLQFMMQIFRYIE